MMEHLLSGYTKGDAQWKSMRQVRSLRLESTEKMQVKQAQCPILVQVKIRP